jgi:geranylgeranyl pyrophosphate synthase
VTLELLHNFFLIHDDIIDGDHLRHGTATLNAIYGNSVALLLGDRLIIEALQIIVSSDLPPEQKKLAHTEFFKMINTTICGEMLDVMAKFPAEEKLIKEIIKNKTAYYTFVTPLKLGAQLAGARDEEVKLIEEFAYQLGDIFQWQDDYLGIFSDEKTLGKPAGSDLREKKPTLLLMKTYQGLAVQDKARLLNLMGRNLSLAELNKARELIKKSGANQWLENKISSTSKSLAESIKKSVLSKNTQNILAGLTKLLLGRKF